MNEAARSSNGARFWIDEGLLGSDPNNPVIIETGFTVTFMGAESSPFTYLVIAREAYADPVAVGSMSQALVIHATVSAFTRLRKMSTTGRPSGDRRRAGRRQ